MNYIEKYFREKTKELGFIELKEGSQIGVRDFKIKDIPLPIITDNLIREIEAGNLEDEIELKDIIEGIVYIMGADRDFPYLDRYKEILLAYNPNISGYMLHKASISFQEGKVDISSLWLRALLILEPDNIDGLFNYGLALEEIGRGLVLEAKEAEGHEFIKSSSNQFESILDIDEGFELSYYKLGFHYKYFERYMKASLIWNKFLILSGDENLKQEIREELDIIKDDSYFETGFTYLSFNDYERALEAFLKLLPDHEESWNVNLLIGQSYSGLGKYDMAIEYMNKAIDLNKNEADIYNEIGIIYFNMGDTNKAIEVFTNGIENCEEDYKMFFNRGLGYVEQGLYEKGLKDIDKAYSLNPNDEMIKEQKSLIESSL